MIAQLPIPEQWVTERTELLVLRHEQTLLARADEADLIPPEQRVTEDTIAALDASPTTAADLEILATRARGRYQTGDTRAFVIGQESLCVLQNCWMRRAADGSCTYVSENV